MPSTDDSALLRQYVENESDEAFAALVSQHINLVYSVALRQVGNPHQAEEITQTVFIILAKKAAQLRCEKALSSWLFQATRLTANNFVRSEIRRHRREQEVYMQCVLDEAGTDVWPKIAPLLDTAVAGLREKDRRAIVLRFYEGRNLNEVGAALGASEEAAKKRVDRALEKLRRFFCKRGIESSTTIIAGAIFANSVQAAPGVLAKTVTAVAVTKGAAVSGSTLALIQGALKVMAWTKAKTAIVVGAGILLAAGTTTITVKEIQRHQAYPWQVQDHEARKKILSQIPPQVKIVPTIFPPSDGFSVVNGKALGTGIPLRTLLSYAYGGSRYRLAFTTSLPEGNYDFVSNFPEDNDMALRREIEKQFHLIGRTERREVDVMLLTARSRNAQGLKPSASTSKYSNINNGAGHFKGDNTPIAAIASFLEYYFEIPVVDHSSMTGRFDVDLRWDEKVWRQNPETLKQALLNELGLELVPSRESIEMLVVEKAK